MTADLETLQHTFAGTLLDVNCVETALALFKGDAKLNRERLSFYRGNLHGNWHASCAGAYPVLQQLVGDDFFRHLIRVYGLTNPSESGNLTGFGAALPATISTQENCREYPYLGDVASLEWQVHCAYYSKQHPPLTLTQLATYSPLELTELRFCLQESCHLFKSAWAVSDIWHAHQQSDLPLPQKLENESHCLVWRKSDSLDWKVHVSSISVAAYAALSALATGATLGCALELALEHNPAFALQSELSDWFGKQLFSKIISNNEKVDYEPPPEDSPIQHSPG